MNMERNEIPLFIRLYEKKGDATNKLVDIMRNSIRDHGVDEIIQLHHISDDPENNLQNILIYAITYDISNKREGDAALGFLKHVFKIHYDNFPAYVEPV